jgi:hypothetical protein
MNSFPNDEPERLRYVDAVKKYRNECGCAMGARFLAAAIAIAAIDFFLWPDFSIGVVKKILWAALLIFTSTIAGKFAGIGLARIRLALLYKSLRAQYKAKEDKPCPHAPSG